ncbi:MAG: DUF2061 domain-containing protein [Candidatus Aminicenantes bacterium]|jgi:uncharacterized membrane protein
MTRAGKKPTVETHPRTVLKTISWRIVATLTTMVIVYIFTGEFLLSLGVGVVEVVAKIVFYYLHERAWHLIAWGQAKHPLASIPVNKELTPEDMDKVKQQLKDLGYMD